MATSLVATVCNWEGGGMIRLSDVRLNYRGFTLGPIDEEIDGRIIGVIGPNGAGKSTLLSIIAGVYEAHHGVVMIGDDGRELSPVERRRNVAACGLSDAWFGDLTLDAHLRLFSATSPQWDAIRAKELIDRLEIPVKKPMKRLSTGTRVKAGLVAAFARRPAVAIFDEPWGALDPIARLEFSDELLRATTNTSPTTIIVSSHDLELVQAVADRLLFINRGRCCFFGTREAALERAGLTNRASSSELYRGLISA